MFAINNTNSNPMTFIPRKGFYTLAQYWKFIGPGAKQITVSSSASPFQIQAYRHYAPSEIALVGINTSSFASLTATLNSLPTIPSVKLYYTSSNTNLALAETVPVSNSVFTVTVPGDCVFTVFGTPLPAPSLIARRLSNSIAISWPATYASAYLLEATTNLIPPHTWLPVTNAPQAVSNQWRVNFPGMDKQQLFRLRSP